MKVIMIERDETTSVVWLSSNEGTAVVQSSLAIDIAAIAEIVSDLIPDRYS